MVHFTKQTAGFYHRLFNDEIKAIAERYGFTFEGGNGKFSDNSLSMTFTIKSVQKGEKYTEEEIRDADAYYKGILPDGVPHVLGSRWSNGKDTFVLDKVTTRGKYLFHMTNERTNTVTCWSYIGLKNDLKCIL